MTAENYDKMIRALRALRTELTDTDFDNTQLQELCNIFGNITVDVSKRITSRIKEKQTQ